MNVNGSLDIAVASVAEWERAFNYADGLGLTLRATTVTGTWWGPAQRHDLTDEPVNITGTEHGLGATDDTFRFELPENDVLEREHGFVPFVQDDERNGEILLEFAARGALAADE